MAIRLSDVDANFDRELLAQPYGFKGGYLTELWQSVVRMDTDSDESALGLGTQSVLWADADIFARHTESGGNALMFALTEFALQRAREIPFDTPIYLLETLLKDVKQYAERLMGGREVQETFLLNALVPIDHAAWLLYARENGFETFNEMIPDAYREGLSYRHDAVASIPTFGYDIPLSQIDDAADQGYYFMKIKIGQPGTQEEMLQKDMQWLSAVHDVLKDRRTTHTESGHIPYYLDANGRYGSTEALMHLLDHADEIGALDRIVIVEEPFQPGVTDHVGSLPVRVAADESAHTDRDAEAVIEQGYGAIALKPIAKTLSMTMKIAQVAYQHEIPCFCADLTVNPILVDWNKNVAARLAPFPGFRTGLLETNGQQNYADWDRLSSFHPRGEADWTKAQGGVFQLSDDFYETSGGIFDRSAHYDKLVSPVS